MTNEAIFVHSSDFHEKYKYLPEHVENLKLGQVIGVNGDLSTLVDGVLLRKTEEPYMPADLPWSKIEIYSCIENVLLEDSMPKDKQLRAGVCSRC